MSEAFDQAVTAGAVVDVRATVLRNFQPVVDVVLLSPGASVSLDETAGAVRQLNTCEVADPDGILLPLVGSDPLAPYGSELQVEVGVQVAPRRFEYVPAGVFRLQVSGGGPAGGAIPLKGADRSVVVAAARHEVPYVIAGGASLGDAAGDLLAATYPGLPTDIAASAYAVRLPYTPTVFLEGDQSGDPWSNLRELCAARGHRVTITAAGVARVEALPDLTDPGSYATVREYVPGPDNLADVGTLPLDTTGIANVWVASGQGAGVDPPVRASAEVTDPTSPLYPAGGFGRRPRFLVSQYLTTTAQCQAAADAMKAAAGDPSQRLTFSAAPHPAHEPSDVVRYSSTLLGVDVICALGQWTLQLDLLAASTYTTRRVA